MNVIRLRTWLSWHARHAIAVFAHHSGLDALYRRASGPGLVVLMLHRLRDEHDPWPLSMSTGSFARIVGWLRGRRALVGLEEGLRALADPAHRGVQYAVTFDDGYRDNLRLLDGALAGVPAVVYVATGHVGGQPIWVYRLHHAVQARTRDRVDLGELGLGQFDLGSALDRVRLYAQLPPRLKRLDPQALAKRVDEVISQLRPAPAREPEMLDWEEARRLDASGVAIGAHTRNHVLLARADDDTARAEILHSQADIAAALQAVPAHFAYPNGGAGDFGEREVAIVREAGFRTAVTSIEGTNRRGYDPYRILRHNVHEQRYRAPSGRLSRALFFSETSGVLGWLRARRAA